MSPPRPPSSSATLNYRGMMRKAEPRSDSKTGWPFANPHHSCELSRAKTELDAILHDASLGVRRGSLKQRARWVLDNVDVES